MHLLPEKTWISCILNLLYSIVEELWGESDTSRDITSNFKFCLCSAKMICVYALKVIYHCTEHHQIAQMQNLNVCTSILEMNIVLLETKEWVFKTNQQEGKSFRHIERNTKSTKNSSIFMPWWLFSIYLSTLNN